MQTRTRIILQSLTLSTALVTMAGLTSSGCHALGGVQPTASAVGGGACAADFSAKMKSLQTSVDGLAKVSAEIRGDVFLACQNIANDLGAAGVPAVKPASATDDDVKTACDLAKGAIDAQVSAGVKITLAVEPGYCEVAADAQLSCEAKCDVSGGCDPGSVEVRCEPGQLAGECTAECSGQCRAEANVAVACEGSCQGTCTGECSGTCAAQDGNGGCAGACDGTCKGTCSGTCDIEAGAKVACNGTCKGACSVDFTAPSCEGALTPPKCDIDADCEAGCDGQAKFEAECVPPRVAVAVDGSASSKLASTLETNLPAIVSVAGTRGQLVSSATGDVAKAFGDAVAELADLPGCLLVFAGDFAGKVATSVEASASVSVSVSASASVAGSARAG